VGNKGLILICTMVDLRVVNQAKKVVKKSIQMNKLSDWVLLGLLI